MTVHIFNPEHDIALASNLANFTAPHAGRQLRHDLGFLPALWAAAGDVVLVDDVELAKRAFEKVTYAMKQQIGHLPCVNPRFTPCKPMVFPVETCALEPWGWNRAVKARLERCGVGGDLLPTEAQLDMIRHLSHRRTSAQLLPRLQREGTVGEAFECRAVGEVEALSARFGRIVMKAPWSSSGRGVRFTDFNTSNDEQKANSHGWLRHVIERQGSVIVEPLYAKVKDFGMEFTCTPEGEIRYLGLSLFHTANGAYTGNLLATENTKRERLSRYVPIELLDAVQRDICALLSPVLKGNYAGPFGVDMMVVAGGRLHPCVEINLRRTMGHVALALSPQDDDIVRVMRIDYENNNYKLKIQRL